MNVHNVGYVRQIEIHTAEPLVLCPSRLQVGIAIAKLKQYKIMPHNNQIPAKF
jgi:hypothetical protein